MAAPTKISLNEHAGMDTAIANRYSSHGYDHRGLSMSKGISVENFETLLKYVCDGVEVEKFEAFLMPENAGVFTTRSDVIVALCECYEAHCFAHPSPSPWVIGSLGGSTGEILAWLNGHFCTLEHLKTLHENHVTGLSDAVGRLESPLFERVLERVAVGLAQNIDAQLERDKVFLAVVRDWVSAIRLKAREEFWKKPQNSTHPLGQLLGQLGVNAPPNIGHLGLTKSVSQTDIPLEVERKYLLSSMPDLKDFEVVKIWQIEQGYLPGEMITERLRRARCESEVKCTRTVKLGTGVTRVEFEDQIDDSLFELLWPATSANRISKKRHVVKIGSQVWELDEFTDRNLVLLEIELGSENEHIDMPENFKSVLVREVTNEKSFTNWSLSNRTTT